MSAHSIPPVLSPEFAAKPLSRHEAAYRAHLGRVHRELLEQERAAAVSFDRQLRACMLVLRELRERRLDIADAVLADGEPVTDWQAAAEARRGR